MSTAKLTIGPIYKRLLQMALPMMAGILSIYFFGFADTYFVSKLGTSELAALTFVFPVAAVFFSLIFGIGHGTSSVIARALGNNDEEAARRYATDSITLAFIIAFLIIVIGLLTIKPMFTLLGASEEVLPHIISYMRIWYLSAIFLVVPIIGNTAIRATGNAYFPAAIMITVSVLNIIFDPLLIFGIGPFPRLEIQGAALATALVRFFSFSAVLYFLYYNLKVLLPRRFNIFVYYREIMDSWRRVLHVGAPAALSNIIEPATLAIITWMLADYGTEIVAGFGIAARIEGLSLVFIFALATAIGPVAGQNYGAGFTERVSETFRASYYLSIIWGLVMAVILFFLGPEIVSLFGHADGVSKAAILYLTWVPVSYAAKGIALCTSYAYNGIGKPKPAIILTITRMLVLYVPLAFVLQWPLGYLGIFLANTISSFLAAGLAVYFYRKACMECRTPDT
jgi:putative MATE family efflux protein